MPIEPLSITAAVIGVVRLTYDSCKSLNENLNGIKHAPEKLETLRRDLTSFLENSNLKPRQTSLVLRMSLSHQTSKRA